MPWGLLLIAAGIALIAGDGWFDGQTLVGWLSLVSGVVRGVFSLTIKVLAAAILAAAISDEGVKVPPRTKGR